MQHWGNLIIQAPLSPIVVLDRTDMPNRYHCTRILENAKSGCPYSEENRDNAKSIEQWSNFDNYQTDNR